MGDLGLHLHMISWAYPSPHSTTKYPNDISIASAVFAGLTSVTDGRTDRHDRQTTLLGRCTGDAA